MKKALALVILLCVAPLICHTAVRAMVPGAVASAAARKKIVNVEFKNATLTEALTILLRNTGLVFSIDLEVKDIRLTAKLKGVSLDKAIQEVMRAAGVMWWIGDNDGYTVVASSRVFGADVRTRVFEAKPEAVDRFIPTSTRKVIQGSDYTVATVSAGNLASLADRISDRPGILVDHTRKILSWPRVADTWSYSRADNNHLGNGGGAGFIGVRVYDGMRQVRLEFDSVTHSINTQPPVKSAFNYEGPAPDAGGIVFVSPFQRTDGTRLYHVIAFEISNRKADGAPPTLSTFSTAKLFQAMEDVAKVPDFASRPGGAGSTKAAKHCLFEGEFYIEPDHYRSATGSSVDSSDLLWDVVRRYDARLRGIINIDQIPGIISKQEPPKLRGNEQAVYSYSFDAVGVSIHYRAEWLARGCNPGSETFNAPGYVYPPMIRVWYFFRADAD
ncbi:MAG: STN domain-containing protein [Armatimonadota bacterium]